MMNTEVQFPYVNETSEGLVYSGIVPIADGSFTVVAVCPTSRRKVYYETGHENYVDAAYAAEHTAWQWFDKDESQLKIAA